MNDDPAPTGPRYPAEALPLLTRPCPACGAALRMHHLHRTGLYAIVHACAGASIAEEGPSAEGLADRWNRTTRPTP